MFCTSTFDRGLRFCSGLLILKFTAAVGVFTWAYLFAPPKCFNFCLSVGTDKCWIKDVIAWNSFLAVYQQKQLWQITALLVEEMFFSALRLDVVSYSTLPGSGSWRQPHDMLEKMRTRSVRPDKVSLNSFITRTCDWTLAVQVLEGMAFREEEPDTVSYGAALGASGSHWPVALVFFEKACQSNLVSSTSLTSFLVALGEGSEWQRAFLGVGYLDSTFVVFNLILCECRVFDSICESLWPMIWASGK